MNSSTSNKSNAVLDSDDELDEIITEFAEEEGNNKKLLKLSESEDEIDNLIEEFAASEADSDSKKCENKASIPVFSDDDNDDILEALSEEFKYDVTETVKSCNSPLNKSNIPENSCIQNNNVTDATNNVDSLSVRQTRAKRLSAKQTHAKRVSTRQTRSKRV